jgi:hypothetical protein
MALLANDEGAFNERGARVVDAGEHRLHLISNNVPSKGEKMAEHTFNWIILAVSVDCLMPRHHEMELLAV